MRHPWTFAVLATALLSFVLQFSMVSVALQDLLDDLGAPLRWGGWALTAFLVTQVVTMSFAGRLAERFGAVEVFRFGVAGFAVCSLICAVAPNFTIFLAARALQGAFGGVIMPAGQAILGALHGERDRSRVLGLFASFMPFGAVVGPFLGGIIVEVADWRWTFVLSLPLMAVTLVGLRFVLPRAESRRSRAPLDGRGAVLMLIFIPSLILALTELGLRDATPNPAIYGTAFAVAAVALMLLVWQEQRVEHPVLDLEIMKCREFFALNALAFLFGLAWMGVFAILPLYVQAAYGMGPAESGALMGPRALAMAVVSTGAAMVIGTTGFRIPLVVGLAGLSICLGLIGLGLDDPRVLGIQFSTFWWLMLLITVAGLFFGFSNPAMNSAGMDLIPHKIASIAGMRGTFMMLGGTIGISLVVMSGSRAADVGVGMERMFLILATILFFALFAVRWTPARPGAGPRARERVEASPQAGAESPVASSWR
ncbi:MAG: MFS transporter [Chloroflexi bacterium]|nr:MFS transporter [Chloroflexota bacterium]